MTRQETEQAALAMMTAGYNCAETLLQTAITHLGVDGRGLPLRVATCFGGGLGRSKAELCGALSGSIMAISLAYGRDTPASNAREGTDLAAAFRDRFRERFGTSNCGELLAGFGPQENWSACKRLVAETAGLLYDLLEEKRRPAT